MLASGLNIMGNDMVNQISARQYQILKLLLENKAGMTLDEIAGALSISRNAVQQHFIALERDGYVQAGTVNKTAGRPARSFVLTDVGVNYFPKQYAWFSELVLADLKEQMGSEALQNYLHKLGNNLSHTLLPRFAGKQTDERMAELIKIMDELGFQAQTTNNPDTGEQSIVACNCIYHDLAQKHHEICQFDRVLISSLLDKEIDHHACMAKGDAICSFKIKKTKHCQ